MPVPTNTVTNTTTGQTYSTIQAAIDGASAGDAIQIGAGTYNEHVNVTKSFLTLTGVGEVTIQGSFASDNPTLGSADLHTWIQNVAGYSGASGDGLTIGASGVTVTNINIDGFLNGVRFAVDTAGVTLNQIDVSNSVIGIEKSTTANLNGLTVNGGSFTDGYIGIDFAKATGVGNEFDGMARNVTINGTTFTDLTQKGIYAETLTDSTITGVIMSNVGQYGGGQAFGANGRAGNGINLNLKTGTYDNIVIENFTLTNTGMSNKEGAALSDKNGAAIAITARDDGGTYGPQPAVVTDAIIVRNGTINGTSTGVQVGEPTKTNADPDVKISGVAINGALHDALHGDIGNETQSTLTYEGTSGADTIVTSASSTGKIVFHGGGGNDDFTGHAEHDTLDVDSTLTAASFAVVGGKWQVTADGTDTLSGVEKTTDGTHNFLLVGAGGYATIQAAVNAAADGDVILIAEGTYVEQVTINGKNNITLKAVGDVNVEAPANVVQTATSSSGRAINAVVTVLNGTNVQIDGLDIDGKGAGNTVDGSNANFLGVFFRNASGGLEGVDITGTHDAYPGGTTVDGFPLQSGNQRGVGLQVDNDTVLAFFMHGGSISDFQKNGTVINRADLDITGVHITGGGAQTVNAQNGLQVSNSTGTIDGNTIDHIGYAGSQLVYSGGVLAFGNTDLDITDNTITGANDGTTDAKVVGIYLADFGTPNSGGNVTGNTLSHVDEGIDVSGGITPDGIVISGNTISNLDTSDPYHAGLYFAPDAGSVAFNVTGTDQHDEIHGSNVADTLNGGGGDDLLDGGAGSDTIGGGNGGDTALYSGNAADYTVTYTTDVDGHITGFTSVSDGTDTDTLTSIETVQFADVSMSIYDPVQVFDGTTLVGTFATIQAGIDAASAGNTILIAAGTYNEHVNVNKADLTLTGQGDVIIQGTFETDNTVTGDLNEWLHTAVGYHTNAAGDGVTIAASGITLSNINIDGFYNAMMFATDTADITLTDVDISNSINGIWKTATANIDGLTINQGSITDAYVGIQLNKATGVGNEADGVVTGLTITGTHFDDITRKGIYAETLTDSILTGIVMNNVGQWGAVNALDGANGTSGSGINLNLKAGTYDSIVIEDFTLTDTGLSNGGGTSHRNGGAIVVEARDDGGTYGPAPAVVTDAIIIRNGTIDGTTSTGIQVGEPNKTNADPDVSVSNVAISGAQHSGTFGDLGNESQSTLSYTGTSGDDTIVTSAASTGTIVFTGGTGNDSFTGHNETDVAHFATTLTIASFSYDSGTNTWTVSAGTDGTDTLAGVEKVTDGAGHTFLLVDPAGSYTTIQAAVIAAAAGDTILVGAGTYNESVTVNKAVTIIGANHGIDGTGTRGAESIVNGQITVTASTGNVLIDGLFVQNASGNGVHQDGIAVTGAANVTVENSVIHSIGANGSFGDGPWGDVAFYVGVGATGNITFDDNLIDGTGTNSYGNASWARAMQTETDASTLTVTGNTITGTRSGIGLAGVSSTDHITGNTLTNNGTAIAAGLGLDMTNVTGNTFSGNVDEFNLRTATGSVNFDASGQTYTDNGPDTYVRILGGNDVDTLTGTDGKDYIAGDASTNSEGTNFGAGSSINDGNTLNGKGGADILLGSTGKDDFTGGADNDTLSGGGDIDTAHFADTLSTGNFSASAGAWSVASTTEGTDTLTSVEKVVDGSGAVYLLVGEGGFATIQAAINAATGGETILIAAGTYNEKVNVNKAGVTLVGLGNVTVQGTFATDNPTLGANDLHTWIQNVAGYNGNAGDGITIAANNVTVSNINIDGFLNGVRFAVDTAGTTLTDIDIANTVVGVEKSTTANINGLTVNGGSITDGYMGFDFAKATGIGNELDGVASNVLISGTHFTDITQKGIYMETLTDSTITGVVMDNVGQYGGGQAFGANGRAGNGINLNLKAGTYDNIVIENFDLTDTGASNKEGAVASDKNGAAIAITARDDGGTYGPAPGVVTDAIIIRNGTIDGNTATGIQVGEPTKTNADPDVNIVNVTISGAQHTGTFGDIGNETQSTLTYEGTSGDDAVVTSATSTGTIIFEGGAGNDNFTGHNELDIAQFGSALSVADFSYNAGTNTWTISAGADGTDSLIHVEKVVASNGTFLLVDPLGSYTTLQAAVNAAQPGDTIIVAAGTYNEAVTIDKAVTIIGANHGIDGTGARGAESIVTGQITVTAASGNVLIDGLYLQNASGNGVHQDGVAVTGAANVTIENSVFWATGPNGSFGDGPWGDVAVYVGVGATGNITLDDNLISGAGTNAYGNASWARATQTETDASTLTITGNTINGARSGIGLAGLSANDTISGNTLTNNGTAFAAGLGLNLSGVTGNTFSGNVDEFNLRTATGGITFDASGQTYTDNGPDTYVRILGGNDVDSLTGTDGKDYIAGDASTNSEGTNYGAGSSINDGNTIDGKGGNDILLGATGNDTFTGGSGDDDIYGGAGTDTAVFTGNWASYTITEAAGVYTVSGVDGTDTLHDIENLRFADGDVAVTAAIKHAPVGNADAYTTNEDQALIVQVASGLLANDTDADGDTLTATVATGPANGSVIVNTDGSFVYTPNANYNGTDSFTYTVSDGTLSSGPVTVTLTVNSVNDAPVGNADSYTTNEDQALIVQVASGVLANDTDADLQTLTATVATGPAHGSVTLNTDGSFVYTPTANYNGSDSFTYTVSDGTATSAPVTVSLTVNAVNDAPVAGADSATVTAGGPRTITLTTASLLANDTDADGTPLTITGVSTAAHGTLTFSNNGTAGDTSDDYITYTPTTGYSGSDTFNYILSDGTTSALGAVNVNVQAVTATYTNGGSGNDVIDKSGQTGVQLINGAGGNDTLTGGSAADTLNGGEGNDTLNGGPGADTLTGGNGADIFVIAKADMASGVDKITDFTGAGNGAVAGDDVVHLSGFGVGATLTKISDVGNAHTYRVTDGAFTGTFVAVYSGNATLVAGDYAFINPVSPGNTAPVAAPDNATVAQNGSVNIATATLLANDSDAESNPLSITAVGGGVNGTAVLNNNGTAGNTADDYVVFTPTSGYSGPASFTYTLSDTFTTSTGTVNVTVTAAPVNNLPVANNDAYATNEDTVLSGSTVLVNDSDADSQPLTAQLVTGPAHGSLTFNSDGTFTYTPFANYNGTDSFTYKASDGIGTGNTATVNLTINPVNDAPVAGTDAATVLAGGPRTITLTTASLLANDTDADSNPLTITGVTAAAHGTAVFSDNGTAGNTTDDYITYTPTSGYAGADSFTYVLSDGTTTANGTVNITVQAETTASTYTSGTAGADTYDFSARTNVQLVSGNGGNDVITGGSAADSINGGADNDTINGGGGKDTLTGGTGLDTFVFTSADGDKVVDFVVADDTIALSKATFTALTEQNNVDHILLSNQFVIGTAATTTDHHVIYNASTGILYYDADGSGSGAMVQIAQLSKNLTLTHDDFVVWN